jgi:hypothetical protein
MALGVTDPKKNYGGDVDPRLPGKGLPTTPIVPPATKPPTYEGYIKGGGIMTKPEWEAWAKKKGWIK